MRLPTCSSLNEVVPSTAIIRRYSRLTRMKKKENAPTRAMSMTKDLMMVYCSITYSGKN